MSKNSTVEVIILGHRDFGEYDKQVHLYSEELGKIKAIAKGSRKITSKFTGHLETLNVCQVVLYFGPRNTIITEIQTIKNWSAIRDDFGKLKSALQISEITNQMIYENQTITDLHILIKETITLLETTEKCDLLTIAYILKFLDRMGLLPNFQEILPKKLELKYMKFFHFLLTEPFEKIITIHLQNDEKKKITALVRKIIENQIDKPLSYI